MELGLSEWHANTPSACATRRASRWGCGVRLYQACFLGRTPACLALNHQTSDTQASAPCAHARGCIQLGAAGCIAGVWAPPCAVPGRAGLLVVRWAAWSVLVGQLPDKQHGSTHEEACQGGTETFAWESTARTDTMVGGTSGCYNMSRGSWDGGGRERGRGRQTQEGRHRRVRATAHPRPSRVTLLPCSSRPRTWEGERTQSNRPTDRASE